MAEREEGRWESHAEHEVAQHRRFAILPLAEKLAWLEQAQAFVNEALEAKDRRERDSR